MWDSDHKDSSVLKNWCFWTVVLEKTPENLLDCKEIKPVNPKGNQSWIFIGMTDAEAEAPILWPPDTKSWLIGKDPDAGKDWRQKEKGMTEVKMVGWHHRLNGHEFELALGVGDGQGSPMLQSMNSQSQTRLSNWVELNRQIYNLALEFFYNFSPWYLPLTYELLFAFKYIVSSVFFRWFWYCFLWSRKSTGEEFKES